MDEHHTLRDPPQNLMTMTHHHHYQSTSEDVVSFSSSSSTTTTTTTTLTNKRDAPCSLLECQSLQSSIKRVKLSLSPGELRLKRDLALLGQHGWIRDGNITDNWIHTGSDARLSLVDALRLCLFIPHGGEETPEDQSGDNIETIFVHSSQSPGEQSHQGGPYNHQYHRHCHHNVNYVNPSKSRRQIWIQFPRRYPHKPPVVSRIEGFAVEHVVVNDTPPPSSSAAAASSNGVDGGCVSPSAMMMTRSQSSHDVSSLYNGECNLTRQRCWEGIRGGGEPSMSYGTGTTGRQHSVTGIGNSLLSSSSSFTYQVCGTTVVWSHWSPVVQLGEFLDFLLSLSHGPNLPRSDNDMTTSRSRFSNNEVGKERKPYLSASVSFPSLYQAAMAGSSHLHVKTKSDWFVEEQKMDDSSSSTPTTSNVEAELKPNRFDVGYAKVDDRTKGTGSVSSTTSGCSDAGDYTNKGLSFRDVKRNEEYDDDLDDDEDENDEDAMDLYI